MHNFDFALDHDFPCFSNMEMDDVLPSSHGFPHLWTHEVEAVPECLFSDTQHVVFGKEVERHSNIEDAILEPEPLTADKPVLEETSGKLTDTATEDKPEPSPVA